MDGDAVREIALLEDKQKTILIDGKTFAREEFKPVYHDPRPSAIKGKTLTGLIDYIRANREKINYDEVMIQIIDFSRVDLFEKYSGESANRTMFFSAVLDEKLPVFPFDQFLPVEDFIIKGRALFEPSADLDEAIALVSRVTEQNEITTQDNGLAQNLQLKKGLSGALTEGVTTKCVYTLRPYRTFRDISEHPESKFILRLKAVKDELPRVALFDAEGGVWRNQAVAEIKNYLLANLIEVDSGDNNPIKIPILA